MHIAFPSFSFSRRWLIPFLITTVFVLSLWLGLNASPRTLLIVVVFLGGVGLLHRFDLGFAAMIVLALFMPVMIGTGTEVSLNLVTVTTAALLLTWLLLWLLGRIQMPPRQNPSLPLLLFLGSGLLSLVIGNALWDPSVPKKPTFIMVQLAQWAIFAFSAGAFWLAGMNIHRLPALRRLTIFFTLVAGTIAIVRVISPLWSLAYPFVTGAVDRAPLWTLLAGIVGGQLLYDTRAHPLYRLFQISALVAIGYYSFVLLQENASTWVGVLVVISVLVWLRFPRMRVPIVAILILLAAAGLLFPALYGFAGGDDEWQLSGGSRMALTGRVIEEAMRNPITGLGPAAYRNYAMTRPLAYGRTYWIDPRVSAHNNYVDLFAHMGLVGLALFAWFVAEMAILGVRLNRRYRTGFAGAYVNGMLGVGIASLVLMLMADWILPYVYNISFEGFQASILVWLFLGGLLAVDRFPVNGSEENLKDAKATARMLISSPNET